MPTVQNRPVNRANRGARTKEQIETQSPEALARDDISRAFAGKENESPSGKRHRGTKLKERKTKKSRTRTPIH